MVAAENPVKEDKFHNYLSIIIRKGVYMLEYLVGTANTGDSSKPWLIAICMIVSIVVVVALFIIGQQNTGDDDEDVEE